VSSEAWKDKKAYRNWQKEQKRLTEKLTAAFKAYTFFHEAGYEVWYERQKARKEFKL